MQLTWQTYQSIYIWLIEVNVRTWAMCSYQFLCDNVLVILVHRYSNYNWEEFWFERKLLFLNREYQNIKYEDKLLIGRLRIIKWLPQQQKLFVVQTSLRHFFKQSKTCANVRIYRYKFLQCRVLKPICARDEIFSNTPTLCNTLCSNHTIKILCTV